MRNNIVLLVLFALCFAWPSASKDDKWPGADGGGDNLSDNILTDLSDVTDFEGTTGRVKATSGAYTAGHYITDDGSGNLADGGSTPISQAELDAVVSQTDQALGSSWAAFYANGTVPLSFDTTHRLFSAGMTELTGLTGEDPFSEWEVNTFLNQFCTAADTPLDCCTGSGTGVCGQIVRRTSQTHFVEYGDDSSIVYTWSAANDTITYPSAHGYSDYEGPYQFRIPDSSVCNPAATNTGDHCDDDGDCPSGTCTGPSNAFFEDLGPSKDTDYYVVTNTTDCPNATSTAFCLCPTASCSGGTGLIDIGSFSSEDCSPNCKEEVTFGPVGNPQPFLVNWVDTINVTAQTGSPTAFYAWLDVGTFPANKDSPFPDFWQYVPIGTGYHLNPLTQIIDVEDGQALTALGYLDAATTTAQVTSRLLSITSPLRTNPDPNVEGISISKTLSPTNCHNGVVENNGATGSLIYTLCAATPGLHVQILQNAGQALDVKPSSGDQIIGLAVDHKLSTTGAANADLECKALDTTRWNCVVNGGTWSDGGT